MEMNRAVEAGELPRGLTTAGVAELRAELETVMRPFAGELPISPTGFTAMTSLIRDAMRNGTAVDSVRCVLSPLTTIACPPRVMSLAAAKLAGNVNAVRCGQPVAILEGTSPDGWCSGVIVEVEQIPTKRRGKMKKIYFQAETGPWAGEEVAMVVSDEGVFIVATHIGFSRFSKPLKMHTARELVGMLVTFEVKTGRFQPTVERYGVTGTQEKYNREIIKRRNRGDCPFDFKPVLCDECPKGQNECPLALRWTTWYQGPCRGCQKPNAWFNPRKPDVCVHCHDAHMKRLLKEYKNAAAT